MAEIEKVILNIDGCDRSFFRCGVELFSSYRDAEASAGVSSSVESFTVDGFKAFVKESMNLDRLLDCLMSGDLTVVSFMIDDFLVNKRFNIFDSGYDCYCEKSGLALRVFVEDVIGDYVVENNFLVKEFPFLRDFCAQVFTSYDAGFDFVDALHFFKEFLNNFDGSVSGRIRESAG